MSTLTFDEKDTPVLKSWIVTRLEDISDADSDVLADYVLALIKSDDPEEQARANCIENLEDFLKEHTQKFVDDVFRTVRERSYIPGYVPPKPAFAPPSGPSGSQGPPQFSHSGVPYQTPSTPSQNPYSQPQHTNGTGQPRGGAADSSGGQSRKRGRDDSESRDHYSEAQNFDRANKQRRRGGPNLRGGRDGQNGGAFQPPQMPPMPPMPQMPQMPQLPGGFPPFDPSNPMAAMMAIQAMGMPMPDFSQLPNPNTPNPGSQRQSPPQRQAKSGQRCGDYDTKGYCAAGGQCPYDHGEDHIVVGGGGGGSSSSPGAPAQDSNSSQYSPQSPQQQSVPQNARGGSNRGNRGGRGRGGPNSARGGRAAFSSAGPNTDTRITSVVVEQIPEEKFTDEEVRNFFQEFGPIEEISMQAYKRLAIIKFKDFASAKRAYESPKVIFDNRFVKVYWYKPEGAQQNGNSRQSAAGGKNHAQNEQETKQEDEEMLDPEEFAKKQAEAQQAYEEKMKKMKETESAKEELDKRIKAQAEERRKLMEKLASKKAPTVTGASPTPDGKLTSAPAVGSSSEAGEPKTEEQQAKEKATENLRAKLAELEAEAETLGIAPDEASGGASNGWYGGSYRGRGGYRGGYRGYDPSYRGRGRGGWRGGQHGTPSGGAVARLDNRPRNVKVTALEDGVDFEDDAVGEALRAHLYAIGPFASIQPPAAPEPGESTDNTENTEAVRAKQRIVSFHERYVAEIFIASAQPTNGTINGIGKVEMTWVANSAVPALPTAASPTTAAAGPTAVAAAGKVTMPGPASANIRPENGAEANGSAHGSSEVGKGGAYGQREDDYDVADDEDEDRWMIT